jgi:hypothetical protein
MAASARHLPSRRSAYLEEEEDYGDWEFSRGERIGAPPAGTRRKSILWGLVIVLAGASGWALYGNQANWKEWLPHDFAALVSSLWQRSANLTEPGQAVAAANARSRTDKDSIASDKGSIASPAIPPPLPLVTAPPEARAAVIPAPNAPTGPQPASAPYEPPTAAPLDPYQAQASAVGLHPDLSRVLLERLSPTDYQNAGVAIRTAVAETPDKSVYIWPRQRKPELALFQVRFVPGAAPGCRRYVVTITKDGWSTTALPMEKCGTQPSRPPTTTADAG